jgi:hypothetical protein
MNITFDMSFDSARRDLKFLLEFRGGIALGYAIGMFETDGNTLLWGPLQGTNSDINNIYPLLTPLQSQKGRFIKVNFSFEKLENGNNEKYSIVVKLQQEGITVSEKEITNGVIGNTVEKIRLLIKLA